MYAIRSYYELCEVDGIGEVLAERVRLSLNSLRSQLALDRSRRPGP